MKTVLERADAYLAKMPVSISRQRGHDAAFRAAVALVRGFDLSEQEALPLLSRWNDACDPPWKESDLRHKLRSAATTSDKPVGYLLEPERTQGGQSTQGATGGNRSYTSDRPCKSYASSQDAGRSHTACSSSLPIPQDTTQSYAAERALLRAAWPESHPLTDEDIRTVAALRGIFPDAVDLARYHGFLRGAKVQGHPCFVITEGTFAQVRRLDGLPLEKADGTLIKARNLLGSQGAFIGQRWLGETTHVLLVEGAIGLIEGVAARLLVDTPHAWSILAATSASSRFSRDAELLERLRGRQVHLLPDTDEAGMDAASSWLADLQAAGVHTTAHFLPKPCKDLGDVLHLPEADCQTILDRIFIPRP